MGSQYDTVDGHNPEIMYHLMENQHGMTYNELDAFFRESGCSADTVESIVLYKSELAKVSPGGSYQDTLSDSANSPSPVSVAKYAGYGFHYEQDWKTIRERLSTRQSGKLLVADTSDMLRCDFFHNVRPIREPNEVLRNMRNERNEMHIFQLLDTPVYEEFRRGLLGKYMPEGPFEVDFLIPTSPDQSERLPIYLPHVFLPGWELDKVLCVGLVPHWKRGSNIAEGRFRLSSISHIPLSINPETTYLDGLLEAGSILGFPDCQTFIRFLGFWPIQSAFTELWEDCLRDHSSELPVDHLGREPIALRIFYSRRRGGVCEYTEEHPNKRNWTPYCHIARYCLKVEEICQQDRYPPMCGQIPVLPESKRSTAIVAWGGTELARFQKSAQLLRNSVPHLREESPEDV